MKKRLIISILAILFCTPVALHSQTQDSVYFTTGIKIGEVTDSSVIIWARLCKSPKPVAIHHERKEPPFKTPIDFDNEAPVNSMDGAVEGKMGQIQIYLIHTTDTLLSEWEYVSAYKDYTLKKAFQSLKPMTQYKLVLAGRSHPDGPVTYHYGSFQTAPSLDQSTDSLLFTASTCQYFWDYDDPERGFQIYDQMKKLAPSFHCQTGDYIYYDKPGPLAYTIEQARHKWHAMNAWPALVDFYTQTPMYLQKDDHDLLKDDAYPGISPYGELTFTDGIALWREQVPIIDLPYRTFRWGKDLQIWLVEVREYRSPNTQKDSPNKTIWGTLQKEWFQQTVSKSDATFKILISPIPVVGPDRPKGKRDNHSNTAFETEGKWLRDFIKDQTNMFVITGDRHWQYASFDEATKIVEFSIGASSDAHAQGWKPENFRPNHQFLRVKGGFLAVWLGRDQQKPCIEFRHYDVNGKIVHAKRILAE